MVMCVTMSIPSVAFAAEESQSEAPDLVPIEESDLSREEALEILGMTETEAEGEDIYVLTCDMSADPLSLYVTIPNDRPDFPLGTASFRSTMRGQDWSVADDVMRVKWGATLISASNPAIGAQIKLMGSMGQIGATGDVHQGKQTYNSDYFYIMAATGRTFHFEYDSISAYNDVSVKMVVSTRGYN